MEKLSLGDIGKKWKSKVSELELFILQSEVRAFFREKKRDEN